jgi:hypothetical protein
MTAPWMTKMPMIERGDAPRVRKMAMSACLSVTVMTSDDTRLKAATAMMRVRITNIRFFSVLTAANQLRFWRVQSRIETGSVNTEASWAATCGARSMSSSLSLMPVYWS